jgi:hypothetical protein
MKVRRTTRARATSSVQQIGLDDNNVPVVPVLSDQRLAADLLDKPHLAPGECPHKKDPNNCLECGTKDFAPQPQPPLSGAENAAWLAFLQKIMDGSFKSGNWEWMARAMRAGDAPPARIVHEHRMDGYRELLQMSRLDVLGLFDKVVGSETEIVETKILRDKSTLEGAVLKLKECVKRVEQVRETRSARWRKLHCGGDVLPKNDRLRLQREDDRTLAKLGSKLRELRARLKKWGQDDRDNRVLKQWRAKLITFGEKYPVQYQAVERDVEYIPDKLRQAGEITSYWTETLTYVDTPVGEMHDFEGYRRLIERQGIDSDGWIQWENAVILQAIKSGLIKAPKSFITRRLGVSRPPDDPHDIDHDAETALIKKTGGASVGGGIYSRGKDAKGRQRKLEDFDATIERGQGGGEPGDSVPSNEYEDILD